jgi:5-methyltetrahydropteroyltriglutamate--homocysteine methyltransferase
VQGTGGYETLMPYLDGIPCDQVLMEYAVPEAGKMSALREFPRDKLLGLGVVDVRESGIPTVEKVVGLVEEALQYLDADRVTLNPDCGFAPGMFNPVPVDEAYEKLKVQSKAARELRDRFA